MSEESFLPGVDPGPPPVSAAAAPVAGLPAVGDIVLYHDPRTREVHPAIVLGRSATHAKGRLNLTVFTPYGQDTSFDVPCAAGEFGHWMPRKEPPT